MNRWPLLLLLTSLAAPKTHAQSAPTPGGLEAGPHAVGFRVIPDRDPTRSYATAYDDRGASPKDDHARPIRIAVWYPAQARERSAPMRVQRYVELLGPPIPSRLSGSRPGEVEPQFVSWMRARGFPEEEARGCLSLVTMATEDSPPLGGPFPVLVFGQGFQFESPTVHYALCEYLASHGYVVATSPLTGTYSPLVDLDLRDLETQVRDMEFALARARELPGVDPEKIGLIGFDLGGMSALILAMRNSEVDAMVSLDSGIAYEHNTALLKRATHYDPQRLRIPLLHCIGPTEENEAMGLREDWGLVEAAPFARITVLRMPGMRHTDYTSLPFAAGLVSGSSAAASSATGRTASSSPEGRPGYGILCSIVLGFVDAHLKGDEGALAMLGEAPLEVGESVNSALGPFRLEKRSAAGRDEHSAPPPLESDIVRLILEQGVARGIEACVAGMAGNPAVIPCREETLNRLGYEFLYGRDEPAGAVEIFKLVARFYPLSANAYDSLAEAYLVHGDRDLSIQNYRKSLELNPGNTNAVEKLKELEGK